MVATRCVKYFHKSAPPSPRFKCILFLSKLQERAKRRRNTYDETTQSRGPLPAGQLAPAAPSQTFPMGDQVPIRPNSRDLPSPISCVITSFITRNFRMLSWRVKQPFKKNPTSPPTGP
jgi:hypothetical protein